LEDKFLNNRSGNLMKHSRHAGIPPTPVFNSL
jgi:hypothetical protein